MSREKSGVGSVDVNSVGAAPHHVGNAHCTRIATSRSNRSNINITKEGTEVALPIILSPPAQGGRQLDQVSRILTQITFSDA